MEAFGCRLMSPMRHTSLASLLGMSLRQVDPRIVVAAKILGRQAGLDSKTDESMRTERLEAHILAGGDLTAWFARW